MFYLKAKSQRSYRLQKPQFFRVLIITVLITLVRATHAQETYLFNLPRHDLLLETEKNLNKNVTTEFYNQFGNSFNDPSYGQKDLNTTIILYKNSRPKSTEFSQTAMDIITIVWYVATFLALAAFFLLMACSDRRCADTVPPNSNGNETPLPPPTPSPSYSEFAPPSYETVMKMQHAAKPSIFVITFPTSVEGANKEANNNNNHSHNNTSTSNSSETQQATTTPTTPIINYYTIDELHKIGGS